MWPEPIVGSIGHTGNIAVAAVSIDPEIVGVGVDVEMIFNESENTDVKSQVILENEITLVEKPGDVENLLLTLIFSIKESFFKAAYPIVQKYFGFEFLEVTNIDLTAGRFQVSLTQDLGIHFQQGQTFSGRFEEEPDHVVTVVAINRGNLAA